MSQARHWCFRHANPTESPEELIELFQADKRVRYLVFQKEKGEENGLIHYQGYCEFSQPLRLAALKKIHNSIHWEARRGTRDQARDYCMKDETRQEGPWEFGNWNSKGSGHRSDLESLYKAARTSKSLLEVAEAHPASYLKFYKAVQHVRQLKALDKPTRTTDLEVILVYGKPGLGKTRYAYEMAPDLYKVPIGKQLWFDNYAGEPDVLIDDFSGNMRLVDVLQLIDRYPQQVPVKGGFVWWCPERIFLTANVHPRSWYDYTKRADSYAALTRRFTKVLHYVEGEEPKEFVGAEIADFFNSFDY